MQISDLHFPEHLRYDLRHNWVRTERDDIVVGVTDHAQRRWGAAGFVQLPEAGTELISGQTAGQVSCAEAGPCDLSAPLSGTVVAVNGLLEEDPSLMNSDPYGEGWLYRLEPSDPAELRDLLDAGAYRRLLAEGPPSDATDAVAVVFWYSVDPMLLIDRYRRVLAMNPAAERLTGRDAKSVVGTAQCFHLFHCEAGGEALHGVDCIGVAAREDGIRGGRFHVHCADGRTETVSASYSPLPHTDGGGGYTLITLRVIDNPQP